MYVKLVKMQVIPGKEEEFETISKYNQENSIKEKDIVRFDLLRSKEEPGTYMFYEAYRTREAIEAHKETEHYKKWNTQTATLLARPREREEWTIIAPEKL
ncbi:putative quinol monooxygenase [Spirochaetia bacterium 38H-sp]|uniref:Quinol monooxygenase n=1 Tax=Rarispira pelagica TaxID=3141764 RepID=A0ABU9UBB6_9SPIR